MFTTVVFQLCLTGLAAQPQELPAQAQTPPQVRSRMPGPAHARAEPAGPTVIKAVHLQQARAPEAAELLSALLSSGGLAGDDPARVRIIGDRRTNNILFNGPEAVFKMLEQIIPEIDQDAGDKGRELAIVPVQHREPDDISRHIMSALAREELQIAADRPRSTLIFHGPASAIAQARMIASQLDTPAARVAMEFDFLLATAGKPSSESSLPDDLKPLEADLARFGAIELIGRMSATAAQGERFAIEGRLPPRFAGQVKGRLQEASGHESVRMMLEANLDVREETTGADAQKAPNEGRFLVATTAVMQRGDQIVLGSSPAGVHPGESIIVVVKLLDTKGL